MTTELTWTGTPDDMTARSGEYVLNAQTVDYSEEHYWWGLKLKGVQIAEGHPMSMNAAKSSAINAMNEHLKKK